MRALVSTTLVVVAACGSRSSLQRTIHPPPADPDVVRACVMFYACGGPTGLFTPSPNTVSGCIDLALGPASFFEGGPVVIATGFLETASTACLAAANGCSDVYACSFGAAPGCLAASAPEFCSADHAIHCTGLGAFGDDCAAPGLLRDPGATCMAGSDGVACAFGACDGATPPCDGDVSQTCTGGLLGRFTCPAGTTCEPGGCTGTGAPCSQDRCDGTTLVSCLNGRELAFDCATLPIPSVCDGDDPSCVPSSDLACDPVSFPDRCEGGTLVYCDGDRRAFDCASLGFGCGTKNGVTSCM